MVVDAGAGSGLFSRDLLEHGAGLRLDGGHYLHGLRLPLAAVTCLPGRVARRLGLAAALGGQMRPAGP